MNVSAAPSAESYFAAPTCDRRCHHSHVVHHHATERPQEARTACHALGCGCKACTCSGCRSGPHSASEGRAE